MSILPKDIHTVGTPISGYSFRNAIPDDAAGIYTLLNVAYQGEYFNFARKILGGTEDQVTADAIARIQDDEGCLSHTNCLVAVRNGEIVGYISVYDPVVLASRDQILAPPGSEELAELLKFGINRNISGYFYIAYLAVKSKHQKLGIGRTLLDTALNYFDSTACPGKYQMAAIVALKEIPANTLYRSRLFEPVKDVKAGGYEVAYNERYKDGVKPAN